MITDKEVLRLLAEFCRKHAVATYSQSYESNPRCLFSTTENTRYEARYLSEATKYVPVDCTVMIGTD